MVINIHSEGHWPADILFIERALRAKFTQNDRAKRALLESRDYKLTHDLGQPESSLTSLPANIFIHILETIRSEL